MPENPERGFHLRQHLVRSTGPCPERDELDQGDRSIGAGWACCTRCSRITTRVDERGLPWCGGEPSQLTEAK